MTAKGVETEVLKMDITASTNIKSFNKGQSYNSLKQNHFDLKDREEKGISKNKDFEKLNQSRYFPAYQKELEEIYEKLENDIIEYNGKKSQLINKSRQYKNLDDYVEKRRTRKRVNKDFHGLEFMMVSKLGSMESWQQVVDEFKSHNVSEADTLNCLNKAFYEYSQDFNDSFRPYGLTMIERDTNLDEMGAPHMHSRLFLNRTLKSGLPDTNLANVLKDKYEGKHNNKELMELFRLELDNSLVDKSSQALKDLAHEKGFEFEGLNMIRLKSEEKGLTHNAYKEKQEIKRQKRELQSQQEKLQSQEKELTQRSKALDDREASITSREDSLDFREAKVLLNEEDDLKRRKRTSEGLQKAQDLCDNLERLEEQLKNESLTSEKQLVAYISEPFKKYKGAYNDIWDRANDYWQSGKFKAITKERKQQAEKINKTQEDYIRQANQMLSQIQDDNEQDKDYDY